MSESKLFVLFSLQQLSALMTTFTFIQSFIPSRNICNSFSLQRDDAVPAPELSSDDTSALSSFALRILLDLRGGVGLETTSITVCVATAKK